MESLCPFKLRESRWGKPHHWQGCLEAPTHRHSHLNIFSEWVRKVVSISSPCSTGMNNPGQVSSVSLRVLICEAEKITPNMRSSKKMKEITEAKHLGLSLEQRKNFVNVSGPSLTPKIFPVCIPPRATPTLLSFFLFSSSVPPPPLPLPYFH